MIRFLYSVALLFGIAGIWIAWMTPWFEAGTFMLLASFVIIGFGMIWGTA